LTLKVRNIAYNYYSIRSINLRSPRAKIKTNNQAAIRNTPYRYRFLKILYQTRKKNEY
jgi:hypothetical protein